MQLLYVSTFMFRQENGKTYGLPSCADAFFNKYLDVFSSVRVLGDPVRSFLDTSSLIEMTDPRISVRITVSNKSPLDFKYDATVKCILNAELRTATAVLIKPATRKGMMAIRICQQLGLPYMIEMTGDIHNALRQHPNILKRMYAPLFYKQILTSIKNCKYGLYVSKSYLQEQFPISGLMCGCADVILEKSAPTVLERRYERINAMNVNSRVDIALIGFYQGKMKGVDTAIRALSKLPESYHLNILGNGTVENRKKWIKYGNKYGIKNRIHFPTPLPNANAVLQWLDTQDVFVLPTRSEGFGRCVAEAMSRGCVCFATNICTMPELLDQDCLHQLGDSKKLAELIIKFTTDKSLMKSNAARNFDYAKNYDVDVLRARRNQFLNQFKEYCEHVKL